MRRKSCDWPMNVTEKLSIEVLKLHNNVVVQAVLV